jgi:hypothetical protein
LVPLRSSEKVGEVAGFESRQAAQGPSLAIGAIEVVDVLIKCAQLHAEGGIAQADESGFAQQGLDGSAVETFRQLGLALLN